MEDLAIEFPDDILFVGDVHLGRRPVGLDDVLADQGLVRQDLSPAAALQTLVDYALASRPRAVVFAGDLVDQEDDRFEAYSVLEREVGRLREEHIPVVAVAGNHDGLVLPQLCRRVEGVRLLGAGGVWERLELEGSGPPVDLLGWSFPTRHVTSCPFDHPSFAEAHGSLRPDAVHLGVVHGDLGVSASRYAPIPRSRIDDTDLAAWFLGHVHSPDELSGPRPMGYLGSLTGLHANETGPHGPWRVQPLASGVLATQVLLAPVRWEKIQVALQDDHAVDTDGVHERIEEALQEQLGADPTLDGERLRLVIAEVEFTGRLTDRRSVQEMVRKHRPQDTVFTLGNTPMIVHRLVDRTQNAIDLKALAADPTAIGHVAGCLLDLQAGQDGEALHTAQRTIDRVSAGGWNVRDEDHPLPSPERLLEQAAWEVLDVLLGQRRESERT